jgi:hypothetical protein
LADVKAGKIDVIVVYKVDRLTRSLADFAKLVELFDGHAVSFVSVTQQFNGWLRCLELNRQLVHLQIDADDMAADEVSVITLRAILMLADARRAASYGAHSLQHSPGPGGGRWQ